MKSRTLNVPDSTGLTFEKVWLMFQETSKQFKETDRQFKETDRKIKETDRQVKETDRQVKEKFLEITQKFQETDQRIKKLSDLYGGVSNNSKDVAEEFFYRGLENQRELFGIEYEHIDTMSRHKGSLQGQYDIVLYNGNKLIVIEVKYKLHPKDVDDFYSRKLPTFRKLYPEYNKRKVIGAVAALSVPTESIEKALSYGFLILTQAGNNLSVINPSDFKIKLY